MYTIEVSLKHQSKNKFKTLDFNTYLLKNKTIVILQASPNPRCGFIFRNETIFSKNFQLAQIFYNDNSIRKIMKILFFSEIIIAFTIIYNTLKVRHVSCRRRTDRKRKI